MSSQISNIEIKKNSVIVSINPSIYPLDVVYSASFVMMDKAYVNIDGDPMNKIIVEMVPKKDADLEDLGNALNEELINYSVYKAQTEKNAAIRQTIIQRALLTNGYEPEEEQMDDPEGIAVPWEERYGKDEDKSE